MKTLDAALLRKMFLAGAKNLEAQKEYINELNVFPVPDGDTGTNMSMTIMSAANEVAALEDVTMVTLAKAISSGSLRGARGNSGVILSQLLRGFTKVIKEKDELDVATISAAFTKATETAYKAVMKPKEGTILTVARVTAERVNEIAQETDDLLVLAETAVQQAEETLATTPDLLPVLKEAGVVDSGGQGLLEFLRGGLMIMQGKELVFETKEEKKEEEKFIYRTELVVTAKEDISSKDIAGLRVYLESLGDTVVLVKEGKRVKAHLHTNDPGLVLQKALKIGTLSDVIVEHISEKHEDGLFNDVEKMAEQQAKGEEAVESAAQEDMAVEETIDPADYKEYGFVTVSAGEGLSQIFTELGVDQVITGGQTMNPSTEDIVNAINAIPAKNIFVLPNNKNIILAAEQAVYLVEDKNIIIIPTKTVPQGITAIINFMEDVSPEENKERMLEELANVKTGQLTYAVRDTSIDGVEIHDGQMMAIGDSGLLGVGDDQLEVMLTMMDQMVDEDSEIITLYYGEEIKEDDAQAVCDAITEKFGDCEVELQYGGQPVYYYIVSVE